MTKQEATKIFNHPSGYLKKTLRCAAKATIDPRYSPIGGMSTSERAIEALRVLGFIECARAFADRNKLPIPMGGWVATPEGVKAVGMEGWTSSVPKREEAGS